MKVLKTEKTPAAPKIAAFSLITISSLAFFVLTAQSMVFYSATTQLNIVGPEILRPDASGSSAEWNQTPSGSPNWQCVSETIPDEDGTYVSAASLDTQKDLYSIQNHVSGIGTITKVTVWMRSKASDLLAGLAPPARIIIKTHSTIFEGTSTTLTTSYTNYSENYAVNPQTGQPWTWEEIDTLEVGVSGNEIQPESQVATPCCTQVWIQVYYYQ